MDSHKPYETIAFYLPHELTERLQSYAAKADTDLSTAVRTTICAFFLENRQPIGATLQSGARHRKVRVYVAPIIKAGIARAAEEAGVSRSTWVARCIADAVAAFDAQAAREVRVA